MKKKITLSILLSVLFCSLYAQDKNQDSIKDSNPIIYGDFFIGRIKENVTNLTIGEKISLGFSINHQRGKNLFSLRHINTLAGEFRYYSRPIIDENQSNKETGILYGLRFNENNGDSQSISVGISYNKKTFNNINKTFIGIPFEFNIKRFKKTIKKHKIFGVFPIGKPTKIGRSLGLKIFGNISKESYIGFACSYGFGYHKKY